MPAVITGDSLALLADLDECRIDACVTDPPYELGFMGKRWDASGIAYSVELWAAVLRVLKPGAHLVAFGGTRTSHRMVCAIEDAGFEVRDSLCWLYGSGFPKSLDVSKALDAAAGAERAAVRPVAVPRGQRNGTNAPGGGWQDEPMVTAPATDLAKRWHGWGTALKPAHEPICLARKPLGSTVAACVEKHGTGAVNVDGCRVEGQPRDPGTVTPGNGQGGGASLSGSGRDRQIAYGANLPPGRWPPNVLLDDEAAGMVDEQSGERPSGSRAAGEYGLMGYRGHGTEPMPAIDASTSGASRFFPRFRYEPKASTAEREFGCEGMPVRSGGECTDRQDGTAGLSSPRAGAGRNGGRRNTHPTVKPVDLMRWLVRLVAPPGGLVLDPFTGSGTTGIACVCEGFDFVGFEMQAEYADLARRRIEAAKRLAPRPLGSSLPSAEAQDARQVKMF